MQKAMEKFPAEKYEKVQKWIYRNARPVDLARWQYHFESGGKRAVVKALSAYQNADGGFAHALEEDSWNPESSPSQTCTAAEILFEIGADEICGGIVEGILRYLAGGMYFQNGAWLPAIPSNRNFPHTFWWEYEENKPYSAQYDPTATLTGFILAYGKSDPVLYEKAVAIAKRAISALVSGQLPTDRHELFCFTRLWMGIEKSGAAGLFDSGALNSLKRKIDAEISALLSEDPVMVEGRYPFNSPDSPFYNRSTGHFAEQKLDYILHHTNADGVWDIDWQWNGYTKEFAVSENWWKGTMVLRNMLFLKNFGCLGV